MVIFGGTVVAKTLQDAILDLNEVEAKRLLDEKLADGENPQKIVKELREGVNLLIKKYKEGEVGIVELGMSSRILQKCLESLRGWYEGIVFPNIGRAIIGTIQSDREDISQKLLVILLFGAGFDIFDLGDNVSPELFIKKSKEVSPDIVAISGLDEDSVETIRNIINSFKKSGITAKLLVGPRIGMSYIFTIDDELRKIIPADAFINDLVEISDLAKGLMNGKR